MNKFILLLVISISLIGCSRAKVEGGEEAVFTYQPIFPFSQDGVDKTPAGAGATWKVWTTKVHTYDIKPVRMKEHFKDLTASDNVAIDFDVYMTLQIQQGKTPVLHEKSGQQWYTNKISDKFRAVVRNQARTKSSIDLRTDENVINETQNTIHQLMTDYVNKIELPVNVIRVNIGKVIPPDEVLAEAAQTAAQKQRKQTQEQRKLAEDARAAAEKAAAIADKSYSNEFRMTTDQFLRNKELDVITKAIEKGSDVSLLMNASNATPITKLGK